VVLNAVGSSETPRCQGVMPHPRQELSLGQAEPPATQASSVYLAAILSETFSTLHKVPYFMGVDTFLTGQKNRIYNFLIYGNPCSTT